MKLDLLGRLNQSRAERRAVIVLTDLDRGGQSLLEEGEIANSDRPDLYGRLIRNGKSRLLDEVDGRVFATVHVPPPKLVLVGAVHISQALAPMARQLGYDLTILDPRTAFATTDRFPNVRIIDEWPDVALPRIGIDRWTAFCALTHDPKIDDPALIYALEQGCFYVGALGSRKTHARRVERLQSAGASADAVARIHAPIGLAIGAQSPAEIAVAILGEITATLRLEPATP